VLQARLDLEHFQNLLLLLELERQVRGDGVGEAACFLDSGERGEDLRGIFLFSLTYWSNCAMSARRIASISVTSPASAGTATASAT